MNKQAFTVIELLVVIAVIGMLASIVLVSLKGTREKASIAKAEQFASSVNHVLGAYAVGIWTFDEGIQGSALDASGYGNNGTVNGATLTADRKGQSNKAYSFDGMDDYVNAGNTASLNITGSFTVEAWVYAKSWPDNASTIYSRTDTVNKGIELRRDSSVMKIIVADGTNWFSTEGSVDGDTPLNQWLHIVGTFDGTNLRLYINSILKGGPISSNAPASVSANAIIGKRSSLNNPWDGTMDEVRVYSVALTVGEIQQMYAESMPKYQVVLKER